MRGFGLVVAALALGGCAYSAEPSAAPEFAVYSNYAEILPGRYLLYVSDNDTATEVRSDTYECSAHRFPLNLATSFRGSVVGTFNNLIDEVQLVDAPVPAADLAAQGARGMIIVRLEDVDTDVRYRIGFWANEARVETELTASITVDGPEGRLLGRTVEADDEAQGSAGFACEGTAEVLAESAQGAMENLMGRLGEALANAERLR
jgi:hypothetical protein